MRGRRSQVTVFILIGIVLLLATAFIFYMKDRFISERIDIELEMDKVEGDAQPVQDYVVSCMNDISREGLRMIGSHGGYLSVNNHTLTPTSFYVNDLDIPNSDAVPLTNEHYVPYWYYLKAGNDCVNCPMSMEFMPSIETMQDELKYYLNYRFEECIDEFSTFKEQGMEVTEGETPRFDVAIGESKVYVSLDYPVTVIKSGNSHFLEKYYVEIDLRLKQMYDLAQLIIQREQEQNYLEFMTMDLVSAFSGLYEERLPPIYASDEGYSVVYWVKSDVSEQVGQILNSYVPLISVENTKNGRLIESENKYDQSLFNLLFVENDVGYEDFSAHFMYMDWPIYLEITPNKGGLLGPSTTTHKFPMLVPPIQINVYESFYDIAFPAVVFLRDDEAFAGEGFNFLFAMEGNVKDNIPVKIWNNLSKEYRPWDYSRVSVGLRDDIDASYVSGVDPETNETVVETFEPAPKKLICNIDQRISGDIKVSAYDKITGEAIPDVMVTLKCGAYKSCNIGATNSQGKLRDKFPICIGGAVILEKEGYESTVVEIDIFYENEDSIIAEMEPIRNITANFMLIPTSRLNSSKSVEYIKGIAYDPARGDSLMIMGTKIPDHPFESSFMIMIKLNGSDTESFNILPGQYEINFMYENEPVIVPEKYEEYDDEVYLINEEFNVSNLGGAFFNNATLDNKTISNSTAYYWNVTEEDLDAFSNVQFYVFRMKDPINVSGLEEMGKFQEYSIVYRDYIEPDFFNE